MRGIKRYHECEVPFEFSGGVPFRLGIWRSSWLVLCWFLLLPLFHLIVLMKYIWVRQSWYNQLIVHRRVAIPLFAWVMWFHIFIFVLTPGFQKIVFLRACVVDLLALLVLHVGTCVIFLKYSRSWWYHYFYICRSSLAKCSKINVCLSLQLSPHSFIWVCLSGRLSIPCLCTQH